MWRYVQATGELLLDGEHAGAGYSGFGAGRNNPSAQTLSNIGPLPEGFYAIGEPTDLNGGAHGPFVLPLTPEPDTQTFGRSGFLIHGDSIGHPGTASHGCIILARVLRERIAASGDAVLYVESGLTIDPSLTASTPSA